MKWNFTKGVVIGAVGVTVVFFIFAFFATISFIKNSTITTAPIEVKPILSATLKEVILFDWDKNLLEIQKHFTGGKLNRGDAQKNILASYKIDLFLADIKTAAKVSFDQTEEYIINKAKRNLSFRSMYIINNSNNEGSTTLDRITESIKAINKHISKINWADRDNV